MDKIPAMQRAILFHLKQSGRPESSRSLAARHLKIEHADEETCRRLLAPFLLSVPGVRHQPGSGWMLRPAAAGAEASALLAAPPPPGVVTGVTTLLDVVVLASDGGGPSGSGALRAASLLPVVGGEACQEEHFPAWAAEADEGVAFPPGHAPGLVESDLRELVETIGDLPVVCHRAGREVEPLRRACAAAGIPFLAPVISAAKLGHLLLGLKANHALADLTAGLALETRGPDDCRGRIRTVAAAYLKLLPLLERRGIVALEPLLEYQDMPAPPLDLSRYDFTADDLKALPAAPGVYLFLDAEGRVIYVGKSRNLRTRVGSYFTPGARHTGKGRAILERTRALRIEITGSELEAVLQEAALIQEHAPPLNTQFEVHERPTPYGPRLNLVVVLPDRDPAGGPAGTCTLHYLKGGRYLGRVRSALPPAPGDGGPMTAWTHALERVSGEYFSRTAPPAANAADPDRGGHDLDWQLVGSFLRRHGDTVNVLDVDECASAAQARERLAILARAALTGAGKTLAR